MLKTRILTALVLIPLALSALFLTTSEQFKAVLLLVALLAGWEWASFMGFTQPQKKGLYAVLLTIAVAAGMSWMPVSASLLLGVAWWGVALVAVINYPRSGALFNSTWLMALIGFVVIQPMVTGFIELRQLEAGKKWLLYVLFLVWIADTGAYFSGRRWGSRKLAPQVSPGKTVEGLAGAIVATAVLSLVVAVTWRELGLIDTMIWLLVSAVVVLGSVLGDLTESLFKRRQGIKDSGRIFPGHGGIMDRIDSLTAAVPLLAAALLFNVLVF